MDHTATIVVDGSEYKEWLKKCLASGHVVVVDDGEIFPISLTRPLSPPPPAPRGPRLRGSMSEMMERLNGG